MKKIFDDLINNIFKKNSKEKSISTDTNNLISEVYFKVTGVSFKDRQKIIKEIVNENKDSIFYKPYYGMSNKEILEDGNDIYEINDLKVNSIRIEPTTFNNEDAIEIYITDNNSKEFLIGYVPKNKIDEVFNFLKIYNNNNYRLEANAYFTGGKYKSVEYNEEQEKDIIVTKENEYGINVNLKLYK